MRAVLTMDDVASPNTARYVRYLQKRGVTPTMFVWGQCALAHRAEAVAALREGAIFGNHSLTHPHFSELSLAQCKEEILQNDAIVDSLYREAGVERRRKLFRFPYFDLGGEHAQELQAFLCAEGFEQLCDAPCLQGFVDVRDSYDPREYRMHPANGGLSFAQIVQEMERDVPAVNPNELQVVLIHDHPESAAIQADYFERLFGYLLDFGWTFEKPF